MEVMLVKRFHKVSFSFLMLVFLIVAGCSSTNVNNSSSDNSNDSNGGQKEITMIMTSEVPKDHAKSKLMEEFAGKLEEKTDGGIEVKFYPAGQLYSDEDALKSLGTGEVQSVWPVSVQLESFNSAYGISSLPFSISDEGMLKSEYRKELLNLVSPLVEDNGMKVMGLLRTADMTFISKNTEMKSYKDLKGMKIRVTGGEQYKKLAKDLGATAVALPASEMSTSLSQGVIDAVYSSVDGWKTILGTSIPYGYRAPGLNISTYSMVFDKKWFEGLPEKYQKIITDLTDEIAKKQWKESMEGDKKILDELEDEGVKYHEESKKGMQQLKKELEPMKEEFKEKHPDVYNDFQSLE